MTQSSVLINIKVAGESAKKALNDINGSFVALTAAVGYFAKQAQNAAGDFEEAMRNVNSIAQLTEQQFQKLSDRTRDVAKMDDVRDSAIGISKAMYDVVSSGFEAADALEIAATASRAAAAGQTDTATAVKGLTSLMNAYNQKTLQDSIKFSDQLFAVVNKGVVTFEQLSSNLGSVNAVAAAANISFSEVGAAFIELTKNGVSASESQTQIASLITNVAAASDETKAKAKALGFELGDVALQTKGLEGVLKDLATATGGSLQEMKKFLPDINAAKAAMVLGKEGAVNYAKSIQDVANASEGVGENQKALQQQMMSFNFQVDQVKAVIEDLKIEYGLLINEGLKKVLPYIKQGAEFLLNLDDGTKELIVQLAGLTLGLAATAGALKILMAGLLPIINNFSLWHLKVIAVIAIMKYLHDAVVTLTQSSNPLLQALGEILRYLDLIGAAKEAINTFKSINQANKDAAAIEKEKADALGKVTKLKEKENKLKKEGKELTAADTKALADNLTILVSHATKNGQERVKQEAITYSNLAKQRQKDLDDSKAAEDEKKLNTIKNAQETNEKILAAQDEKDKAEKKAQQEKDKAEQDAIYERERLESDLASFRISLIDNYNKQFMSDLNYRKFQDKKEYDEGKALLDKALKAKLISQSDYNKELDKLKKIQTDKDKKATKEAADEAEKKKKEELEKTKALEKKALEERQKQLFDAIKETATKLKQAQEAENTAFDMVFGGDLKEIQNKKKDIQNAFSAGDILPEEAYKSFQDLLEEEALTLETAAKNYKGNQEKKNEYLRQAAEIRAQININEHQHQQQLINSQLNDYNKVITVIGDMGSNFKKSSSGIVQSIGEQIAAFNALGSEFGTIAQKIASGDVLGLILKGVEEIGETFKNTTESIEAYNKAGEDGVITEREALELQVAHAKTLPVFGEGLAQLTAEWNGLNKARKEDSEALENLQKELDIYFKQLKENKEIEQIRINLIENDKEAAEAQLKLDLKNIEEVGKEENKNSEWINVKKLERLKQYNDKVLDSTKELNEKLKDLEIERTSIIDDRTAVIRDAYDKQRDFENKRFQAEEENISKNIKSIHDKYQAEADKIKEINKLLFGDEEEQRLKQQAAALFETETAAREQTLGRGFFGASESKTQELIFKERQANIEKEFNTGKTNNAERDKAEKELALDRYLYYKNISEKIKVDDEGRLISLAEKQKAAADAQKAQDDYLAIENKRLKLQNEKDVAEEKQRNLDDEEGRELEKLDTVTQEHRTKIGQLKTDYLDLVNSTEEGFLSAAAKFGAALSDQIKTNFTDKLAEIDKKTTENTTKQTQLKTQVQALPALQTKAQVSKTQELDSDYFLNPKKYQEKTGIDPTANAKIVTPKPKPPEPVKPGVFDKGGSLGWLNPLNWFADGGVHDKGPQIIGVGENGPEMTTNEAQIKNLFSILSNPGAYKLPVSQATNTGQTINQSVIVNGSNLSSEQLQTAIISAYDKMNQQNRMGILS